MTLLDSDNSIDSDGAIDGGWSGKTEEIVDQRTLIEAIERAGALQQSVAEAHPNSVNVWNTSDEERADLLADYLDAIEHVCPEPRLIPLDDEGKAPAIKGTCSLGSEQERLMQQTRDGAIAAIERGDSGFALYAGRSEHGTEDLVFADHDDLDRFPLDTLPETLTVVSGSGEGYHETFVNAGDVGNAQGSDEMNGAGEIRASNWYVVLPGSIHPSGGVYHLSETRPITELETDDIPAGLQPSTGSDGDWEELDLDREPQEGEFVNGLGMPLTDVREYDEDLDRLLNTRPRPNSDAQDDSVLDAELVRRLRYHHFEHADIARIWRQYRDRPKLDRDDYVNPTIRECGTHEDRCRYDGSEHGLVLPEWDDTSAGEPSLTLEEAQNRCQSRIDDALQSGEHTLIDALPAMGKSSGVIRGAARTDTSITVFTARHDLYDQYSEWCEEHDLSYHQLPSFHEDCPTAEGEHDEEVRGHT